ncbi:MAG: sigma-70 family RNA polymerase sigma factor [Gemmataceae bacterium]|nr:sigma-70 family RNA polymerase sigma factor [Gemmataceae bacterium]
MTAPAEQLIADAKQGGDRALGDLLDLYRNYLRLLARLEIGQRLQGKVDPSDVVQETFLEAHRHFPGFEGAKEPQFVQWLRKILAGRVAHLVRHYFGTQGRDIRLEEQIAANLDRSSHRLGRELAANATSPSGQAAAREHAVLLADALRQLPPDYREAIILRNFEQMRFQDIATRMGKSQDSVEKLWLRALIRLKQHFGEFA